MNQSALISIFSFLVLLAIAVLFLYLYLRSMRNEAIAFWKMILDKMRVRNDMIPNMIETVRQHSGKAENFLNESILLRSKSWPLEHADGHKVNLELSLTKELHAVWALVESVPALNLDTNFLALKKDFHDLGSDIDAMVDVYNKKVRAFNGPLMKGLRMKRLQVFEFEG